jgi:hypothetical protein
VGFWSGLGKGLLGAGGAIAAPFTGGASLATVIPAITGAAGAVASGIEGGRAAGRAQEAGINANQDLLKMQAARMLEDALQNRGQLDLQQKQMLENALNNRGQLDLQQRQFQLTAPQARAKNSARGDALANLQDVSINAGPRINIPQISGGLRPTLLSDNSRQLGSEMSRQALLQQMQGDTFAPMPDMPTFDTLPAPQIPSITPTPQAGALDTILNTLGAVGAGTNALQQAGVFNRNPYQVKRPPTPEDDWQTQGMG